MRKEEAVCGSTFTWNVLQIDMAPYRMKALVARIPTSFWKPIYIKGKVKRVGFKNIIVGEDNKNDRDR